MKERVIRSQKKWDRLQHGQKRMWERRWQRWDNEQLRRLERKKVFGEEKINASVRCSCGGPVWLSVRVYVQRRRGRNMMTFLVRCQCVTCMSVRDRGTAWSTSRAVAICAARREYFNKRNAKEREREKRAAAERLSRIRSLKPCHERGADVPQMPASYGRLTDTSVQASCRMHDEIIHEPIARPTSRRLFAGAQNVVSRRETRHKRS